MNPRQQAEYLLRDVDTFLPSKEELVERIQGSIEAGRPLRIKLGLDPTAGKVTLGWAVVLWKLREFQDLGHRAVLIVGNFTALVGDPSGQSVTRKSLSTGAVDAFADSVLGEFGLILGSEGPGLEMRFNRDWLGSMTMAKAVALASSATLAQMMERDDFSKRFAAQQPISMAEFMYPLLQGYDSVAVEADIEMGGTDQLFNLMMGRQIQERYGQRPQMVLTMPLLVGTDGTEKMSQSLDNFIGITESPDQMFGKTMSLPDPAMPQWFRLASGLPQVEIDQVLAGLKDGSLHPGEQKRRLARAVVERYHPGEGQAAEAAFDRLFVEKKAPQDLPTFEIGTEEENLYLPRLLAQAGLVSSNSEGRRMIAQGAVRINGDPAKSELVDPTSLHGAVVSVGKRRHVRILKPSDPS
ncbi:MAG: tyrosine--tRNA ligase [bacterium]|nr:tyrosine--tRNA ligase [bacterium]MCY3653415.1 tyrosine--tRNA ligase [bacterium]MYH55134.1 tyrosine--tRNA ligase [Acidimicrobiia bacterium]